MDALRQDLKYSLKLLRNNPVFTLVAILTLALGIGANSAVFSVVNGILLRPLPFKEPERLARVWSKFEKMGLAQNWISEPELFDLKDRSQTLEDVAAFVTGGLNLADNSDPRRLTTCWATASLFPILGVPPSHGRTFTPEEDSPTGPRVVVLSNGLWRRGFNGDPNIVGSDIQLSNETYTVIGVMPPDFQYPREVDLWMPMALDRARPADRGRHYLEVITRLKPNVSIKQAAADVESVAKAIQTETPTMYPADSGWGFSVVSMQEQITGKVRPALWMLFGAAGFVLLIACANLANLLLARATVREKEMALRSALGASRKRLIKQLLTESLILSLAGGAVGLLFAYVCVKLFKAISPSDIPRLDEIGIDATVLGFCLIVSLLTGVGFGLAPALHSARQDLNHSLKESGRGTTDNRHFTLNLFVIAEIALALVLLISSGLMIKSFMRLLDVDLGFRTESILTTRISLPPARYRAIPQVRAFFNQVTEKIKELPGVISVGGISQLPLSNTHASGTIAAEDTSAGEGLRRFHGHPYLEADQRSVTPEYFTSLGIPLIKGRYITEADGDQAPAVVVVDEKFVRAFWPNGEAVGKRVALGEDPDHIIWAQIVGVVGHVRHDGLEQPGREQVYFPFTQRPNHSLFITIHTTLNPLTITDQVRQKVRSIDSDQPIYLARTMEQLLTASVAQHRLNVVLLSIFAGVALVLAAVGIYGVMSYIVTRRTQEIGVRMALGAQPKDILKLFIRKGMLITVIGITLGLFAAFFMTRLIASLLFEVRTWDPILFSLIAVLIAGVALLASFIPVRRATKVDPMTALRFE